MTKHVSFDVVLPEITNDKLTQLADSMGEDMRSLVVEAALSNIACMDPDEAQEIVFDFMKEAMRNRFTPFTKKKRAVLAPKKRTAAAPAKEPKIAARQDKNVIYAICKKFHDTDPLTAKQWVAIAEEELHDVLTHEDGSEFTKSGKYIAVGKLFRRNIGQVYAVGRARYRLKCDDKKPSPFYYFKKVGKTV